MRRLASAALAVGLLATVAPAADDGVHRLPAFDHEGVEASYVVAAPPDYDASRKWPLILDLHGAIAPERRGAEVTRSRLWSRFVERVPCIVAAPNGRTRAWGRVDGELDDGAYVRAVLDDVRTRYAIDDDRVYLAGFSSGSDFACSGGLQVDGPFAATLVVCAGPRSVLGLRDGKLLRAVDHPFLFATGEEDYIRKAGSWEAALALKGAGGRAVYREVPGVGHAFFGVDEYAELFRRLERLARGEDDDVPPPPREEGDALLARAERIDAAREPGAAYEAWWRLATAFHHVPELRERGEAGMAALAEAHDNRTLMRARGDYFRRRRPRAPDEPASAPAAADPSLFRFDRYLGPKELGDALADLARRFPDRCRLVSIGKSIEGRDIPLLEITDRRSGSASEKPAVWIEGAIHGNEASSSMAVLYAAWQFAANPERSRTVDRLLGRTTLYAAPVVNPDALHHYLTEPHSHWRPRFNYRPHDADGDGRVDEDGYEDLDGDGEIGQMYVEDPQGPFVRKGERIVRGDGSPRYRVVGREGRDDDGDGRFSEDPPGGVNLNRNFPVGFRPRRDFEGMRGPRALSEPETRAIVDAVTTRRNVALFLDVHNDGDCLFVWHGPDAPDEDVALQEGIAGRALDVMGYATRPLRHAGAGLSIAWSYGRMGIPSAIVELESKRGKREDYLAEHYDDAGFLPLRPFEHPQLGPILIGGDFRKLPRRQMHPEHSYGQVDRHWAWLRAEMGRLPRLELVDPVITPVAAEPGTFRVTGGVRNAGEMPTDSRSRSAPRARRSPTVAPDWAVRAPARPCTSTSRCATSARR
jgi:poly(3-hydroxybutyrate) depolymerase